MSHGNLVMLTGPFRVFETRIVEVEGREILEVEATIQTGPGSHGGMHRIVLYSETARKANAFVQANGDDGMLATISGTLYSGKGFSRVYVNWMHFHVPTHIEAEGIRLFMGERFQSHRGSGFMA